MNKSSKKILCMGLSAAVLLSVTGISAFAGDYGKYTVTYDDSVWTRAAETTDNSVAIDGTNIISGLQNTKKFFDVTTETDGCISGDLYLKLTAKDEYTTSTGDSAGYLNITSGGKSKSVTSGVYNYSMLFKVTKHTDDVSNKLLMSARMTNDVTWNYALKVVGLSDSQRAGSLCIGLGGVDYDNSNMQSGYNTWTAADAWYKYYININYYTNKVTVGITNMTTGEELFRPYTAVFDPTANSGKLSKLDTTVTTSVRRYGADYSIDDVAENREIFIYKDKAVDDSGDSITASVKFANDVPASAYNPPYNGEGREPMLVLASYDNNGRQININSVKPEIKRTKGAADAVTWNDVSVSVSKTEAYDHADAYIWQSVEEMLPLCAPSEGTPEYTTDEGGNLVLSGAVENLEAAQMIINGERVFDDIHFDNKVTYAVIQPGAYEGGSEAFKKSLYTGETEFNTEDGSYSLQCKIKAATGDYKLIVYTAADGYKAYDFSHVSLYCNELNDDIKNNAALSEEEKRTEVINLIDTYKTALGIDAQAYTRLPDSVKTEIADAVLAHEDFTSNEELNAFIETFDMSGLLFINADNTDILADYLAAAAEEPGRFNTTAVKRFNELTAEEKAGILNSYTGKALPEDFDGELVYDMYNLLYKDVTYYEQLSEFICDEDNLFGFEEKDIEEYNSSSNKSGILKTFLARLKGSVNSMDDVRGAFKYALKNPEKQSYGGGGGGGGGGGSSSSSQSVGGAIYNKPSAAAEELKPDTGLTEEKNKDFEDLSESHWAYKAVMSLKKEGIINGISDSLFAPEDNVTREQFVKLLTSGLRMTGVEAEFEFSDVKKDDWFHNAVGAAIRAGIANGISETEFGVGLDITREQAAVMVKRAADKRGMSLTGADKQEFSDEDSISDYAREAVKSLSGAGIINGNEGRFEPRNSLTRAEAAQILYGFFSAAGLIK